MLSQTKLEMYTVSSKPVFRVKTPNKSIPLFYRAIMAQFDLNFARQTSSTKLFWTHRELFPYGLTVVYTSQLNSG